MSRATVVYSTNPLLTEIRWAAALRGQQLTVVVSSLIPAWQQVIAPLEAVTDGEYDTYIARAVAVPGMSARRALIGWYEGRDYADVAAVA